MSVQLSRRRFVIVAGGVEIARRIGVVAAAPTAQSLIERIRQRVGVPWRDATSDGLKSGDPALPVSGIAVALMPTMDVLRRASARKLNLIVALGPTFYTANDAPGPRATDPVYLAKHDFIEKQRLVVWRFEDHWNTKQPVGASTALANALGWDGRLMAGTTSTYQIPETTLDALDTEVRARLNARGVRVVGPRNLVVQSVFVSAGTTDVQGARGVLTNLSRADVVLAGEPREWEAVPYVHDANTAGQPKGLIAIGRIVSQIPGLQSCAVWLRSVISEVPVETVTMDDPYWNPAS